MKRFCLFLMLLVPATALGEEPTKQDLIEAERKAKRIAKKQFEQQFRYQKIAMMRAASYRRRVNRDYLDAARRNYIAASNSRQFGIATARTTNHVPPPIVLGGRGGRNDCCCDPTYYRHYRY